MGKFIVTIGFEDKFTKVHYPSGSFYESENTDRITYLHEEGYLGDLIEDEPLEKSKGKKAKLKPPEKTSSNV